MGIFMPSLCKNVIAVCILFIFIISGFINAETTDNLSSYNIIANRNIFKPLWGISPTTKSDDKSRKEELEALKKADEERKKAQQTTDLENKKHEIESSYTLNGIVFENGKKQAIMQAKKGSTHFVSENDMLDDLKIISIDDAKSEVTADYQGKFTVTFHME